MYCHVLEGTADTNKRLTGEFVPLALADAGASYGLLLCACRHVALRHEEAQRFSTLGIRYKLACLRALNRAISAGGAAPADLTVATALLLAFDEVSFSTRSLRSGTSN